VNMYFTLLNLGKLIQSPEFVFTLAIFGGDEKYKNLKANLTDLLEELKDLKEGGLTVDLL